MIEKFLDCTVITPNHRLAGNLQFEYEVWQAKQGQKVWKTPDILSRITWLNRSWHELKADSVLLTPFQEQQLWQKITSSEQAALLAQEAWELIHEWEILPGQEEFSFSDETRTFQQWAHEFEMTCAKERWVTSAQLNSFLYQALKNTPHQGRSIILYGFTELSPAFQKLMTLLKGERLPLPSVFAASITQWGCVSPEEEWRMAARAANSILQKREERIGIVIPDLHHQRKAVERIFSEVFEKPAFNISLGLPLTDYPLVEAALLFLQFGWKLREGTLTLLEASKILNSPFLGEAEDEFYGRAEWETHLFAEKRPFISGWLWQKVEEAQKELCPHLHRRIHDCITYISSLPTVALPSVWTKSFREQLKILGWPGQRSLSSDEYQQKMRMEQLLDEFAELGIPCGSLLLKQALQLLKGLAKQTVFQAKQGEKGGGVAPVQVLGLLEAGGLLFDRLWVTGFSSDKWPPPSRPHPFIPLKLQKSKQMSHATAERQLLYSKNLVEQLNASATHVTWSWSKGKEEEVAAPSSLIQNFSQASIESVHIVPWESPKQKMFRTRQFECVVEERAPSLQNERVRGGTGILKEQSACPFKAFATYRLKAKGLDEPELGLSKMTRGIVVHEVLQRIWQRLKTQAALNHLSSEQIEGMLEEEINFVFAQKFQGEGWPTRYFAVEKSCLQSLLKEWLSVELKRPPFEVVATERWQKIVIGQLTLTIRIDRIDRLADGSYLLVDYKTGHASVSEWFWERIGEPQLPLYSVASKIPICGIAFACLKPNEMKYKGVSAKNLSIPGVVPRAEEWDGLVEKWQSILETLASEFKEGVANVAPRNKTVCQFCELGSLCRISEQASLGRIDRT